MSACPRRYARARGSNSRKRLGNSSTPGAWTIHNRPQLMSVNSPSNIRSSSTLCKIPWAKRVGYRGYCAEDQRRRQPTPIKHVNTPKSQPPRVAPSKLMAHSPRGSYQKLQWALPCGRSGCTPEKACSTCPKLPQTAIVFYSTRYLPLTRLPQALLRCPS